MNASRKASYAFVLAMAVTLVLSACTSSSTRQPEEPPDCPVGQSYDSSEGACVPDEPEETLPDPDPTTTAPDDGEDAPGYYVDVNASCLVEGDLEGAFPEANMYDYLNCVVPGIDAWIDVTYTDMVHPAGYIYVLPAGFVNSQCQGGPADDMSAHYCPADATVFIGHERLWGFYSVLGDASAFLVIAHEVGHHIEHQAGLYDYFLQLSGGTTILPEYIVIAENTADCVAGAFMNYMNKMGGINGEEDLNDVAATLAAIADSERENRDHGRLQERVDSFFLSFNSTMDYPIYECNALLPQEAPIAVPSA